MSPNNCEIEVTVFGPGYGECILIHVGSDKWVVMDSCMGNDKEPVALTYLKKIGRDPADCVRSVIATHWHDDHVQGIAKVLEFSKCANFVISTALENDDFVAFLIAHESHPPQNFSMGGSEILKSLSIADSENRDIKFAHENTIIEEWDIGSLAHKQNVEIRALSPAHGMVRDFLCRVGEDLNALPGTRKKRITDRKKNDISIASLLTVGKDSVLLGADLEVRKKFNCGWSAILKLQQNKSLRSFLYKVAHHGSKSGHHDEVWTKLLLENPISVATPWHRGGRTLPTEEDIARLKELTSNAYVTSRPKIEKTHTERTAESLGTGVLEGGSVTVRWTPGKADNPTVKLIGNADRL